MAITYGLDEMAKGVSSVMSFTGSCEELFTKLDKLTLDLEEQSWTSDGGREMAETIKNFINQDLKSYISFLEGKIKDLNSSVNTTEEMNRA